MFNKWILDDLEKRVPSFCLHMTGFCSTLCHSPEYIMCFLFRCVLDTFMDFSAVLLEIGKWITKPRSNFRGSLKYSFLFVRGRIPRRLRLLSLSLSSAVACGTNSARFSPPAAAARFLGSHATYSVAAMAAAAAGEPACGLHQSETPSGQVVPTTTWRQQGRTLFPF